MKKKKRVGLFGGSFNPPHDGHLQAALYALDHLKLDEIWLLVTPHSPLKDPASYAPLPDRLEMCKLMAAPHKDKIRPTDIEKNFSTTETADTLKELTRMFPDNSFVWIMGADNLKDFHKWARWQEIMDNYPIAVIVRYGEMTEALASPAARYGKKTKTERAENLGDGPGWYVMNNPAPHPYQARKIVEKLGNGELNLSSLFNELSEGRKTPSFENVAAYILKKGLYRPQP